MAPPEIRSMRPKAIIEEGIDQTCMNSRGGTRRWGGCRPISCSAARGRLADQCERPVMALIVILRCNAMCGLVAPREAAPLGAPCRGAAGGRPASAIGL